MVITLLGIDHLSPTAKICCLGKNVDCVSEESVPTSYFSMCLNYTPVDIRALHLIPYSRSDMLSAHLHI